MKFDPRITPYRSDIAAIELKGAINATNFVEAELYRVVSPYLDILVEPTRNSSISTQALVGEVIKVYDVTGSCGWGQLSNDGYVGYFNMDSLEKLKEDYRLTHKVIVPLTFIYPEADIKCIPLYIASFSGQFLVVEEGKKFYQIEDGGFIYKKHLSAIDNYFADYVATAELFINSPYLWGGKQTIGLDCSALVQLSLSSSGIETPRDSDMQAELLGSEINYENVSRGDLVFWSGHVGIVLENNMLLHANGYHMQAVVEPLKAAIDRISIEYGDVTCFKRL